MDFIVAPIPVPLNGWLWLKHPCAIPLVLVLMLSPTMACIAIQLLHGATLLICILLLCLVAIAFICTLARNLVQDLVQDGMQVAADCLHAASSGGCCCAVGFSWGGGVLHRLIAEQRWDGAALLLCPATTAMSLVAGDVPPPALTSKATTRTIVLSAKGDEAVDGEQNQAFQHMGVLVRVLDDEHKLVKDGSLRTVVSALRCLVNGEADATRNK